MGELKTMTSCFFIDVHVMSLFVHRYNKTTSQYEMTVQRETQIEPVEDDGDVPKIQFDFKRISDIENLNVGEVVDVIGALVCQRSKGLLVYYAISLFLFIHYHPGVTSRMIM